MVLVDPTRRLRGDSPRGDAEDSDRRIEYITQSAGSGPDRLRCRCRRCGEAFSTPSRLDAHDCPSQTDDHDGGRGRLVTDGGRITRVEAEKERGLLSNSFTEPCRECGGVVFDWWETDGRCKECARSESAETEQTRLVTDGGRDAREGPAVLDVVELPDSEQGGRCPMWRPGTGGLERCTGEVAYVFVYDANADPESDVVKRRNCRACASCAPSGRTADAASRGLRADGGGPATGVCETCGGTYDAPAVEKLDGMLIEECPDCRAELTREPVPERSHAGRIAAQLALADNTEGGR